MNAEKGIDTVVKDALKITNTLNKHLLDECPHCKELLKQVEFDNED